MALIALHSPITHEGSNTTPWHWLMLVVHTVIAISLVALVAISFHDSLLPGNPARRRCVANQLRTARVSVVDRFIACTRGLFSLPCCPCSAQAVQSLPWPMRRSPLLPRRSRSAQPSLELPLMSPLPGSRPWLAATMTRTKSESLEMGCRKPDRSLSVRQVVEKLTWLVSVAGKPQKQPRRFRKNGIGQIRASVGLSGFWPPPQTRCQSGCHV